MNTPSAVKHISECFIKPYHIHEEAKQPVHLGPWDLAMLSSHYIHKGLLFKKPPLSDSQENHVMALLERLKDSLSATLVHFYPLAGRLATLKQENPHSYVVFIDCNNSPGARFIHADVKLTISDIISPVDVPFVVHSFFDHDRAVNCDGHFLSLLTVQVTELIDGIFIGCSVNHCVSDGTSYWNFFNSWSEVFKAKFDGKSGTNIPISRPPIHKRWFPDGCGPFISLPFSHHDQFVSRDKGPLLREKIFHFSAAALAAIKERANNECNSDNKISTLQALSALIWRCVTRARRLPHNQVTGCKMAVNNRPRLEPPLSQNYFGNSLQAVRGITTAGELLGHELGWAALLVNQAVAKHNDRAVHEFVETWLQSPFVYHTARYFDPYSIMMGSSPRFDVYGNEFGLGKALAIHSGSAHKFDGKVTLYPGCEGGGSMDLEMCLSPHSMGALECDEEFLEALNFSSELIS